MHDYSNTFLINSTGTTVTIVDAITPHGILGSGGRFLPSLWSYSSFCSSSVAARTPGEGVVRDSNLCMAQDGLRLLHDMNRTKVTLPTTTTTVRTTLQPRLNTRTMFRQAILDTTDSKAALSCNNHRKSTPQAETAMFTNLLWVRHQPKGSSSDGIEHDTIGKDG